MSRRLLPALLALSLLVLCRAATPTSPLPSPPICEDTLDGTTPFSSSAIPCIVGCSCIVTTPSPPLLPGSLNTTCLPYCHLDCVHKDPPASPQQSAAAPSCWETCKASQGATPENLGWCMYWCVDGAAYEAVVKATTCVPSLAFGDPTATTVGGQTVSVRRDVHEPARVAELVPDADDPVAGHAFTAVGGVRDHFSRDDSAHREHNRESTGKQRQ
ncbi:R3H domain-containing protein [Mycena kentingensis (nom. inval.)]|nr:R3H domain-containing protein [Mycena kentingensis (nom. inval.)]